MWPTVLPPLPAGPVHAPPETRSGSGEKDSAKYGVPMA
jgi:hypothetical protein